MLPALYARSLLLVAFTAWSWAAAAAQTISPIEFTVTAGDRDRHNTPIAVSLTLPAAVRAAHPCAVRLPDGKTIPAQITAPSLLSQIAICTFRDRWNAEIHFVLPDLPAGADAKCVAVFDAAAPSSNSAFQWHDVPREYSELLFGDRPVLRYVCLPFDESTPAARDQTFKVFHHLYDPAGKLFVTNGAGGLYPHHRGLFYGFRDVTYGSAKSGGVHKVDTWHCKGAHQEHDTALSTEAGPVLGRHRLAIDWRGNDKEVFAREQRELTIYNIPGGTLVEFASRLTPVLPPIKLDGDPQHAGFHFRAAAEVAAKTKQQTYFLRPDGQGAEGETRNWPAQPQHVNLPWDAMSFVLGDKRYTALYLDRSTNPKEARYSERDYGRFGSYFVTELPTADKPLDVNYRMWLQDGELTADQASALAADFENPPAIKLK